MTPFGGNGLDQALERTGDGAFVVGTDGRVLVWNRSAEKILGYTPREVLGKACCDVFAGHDAEGNRLCHRGCHIMALGKMGEAVQNFDMQTRTKANRPVWLNISMLSIPAGKQAAQPVMVHFFRDVTASRELLALVHERLAAIVPAESAPPVAELTRRELEILRMLASGANTKLSAERLHVSRATVRNHVQNIFGKLGVHSRLEAVAYATRHRLL